ncbi:MAG: hypothetical protein ACRD2A_21320, partial [Vicinamibacterales bacterium]
DITDGAGTERFAWWTGLPANATGVAINTSSGNEELLFTSTVGFVWQGDDGTNDNGVAYVAEAATRWEDFGSSAEKKNLRDIYVEASQSGAFSLNIDVFFDYSTSPTQRLTQALSGSTQAAWGTAVWGTDLWPTLGFVRGYLFGVDDGVVCSFRMYTTGADQPWSMYKLVAAVESIGESKED